MNPKDLVSIVLEPEVCIIVPDILYRFLELNLGPHA